MKRIAVLTTSRADFGHLHWPLRRLREHPGLEPLLIVTGAHLSPEFGETVAEIEAAGFAADERIECLLSSDTDVGMAKTIGVALLSLADVLDRLRPDLLLLVADRYEMLAPAAAALALRIPIAHIEGGEISAGAIDDAVRNALTKMSHLHFAPTEAARRRILAMGEEAWRVTRAGAPSLDHLVHGSLPDADALAARLGMRPDRETCVVAIHPVTLRADTTAEAGALFDALAGRRRIVFCFPNADAGSRALIRRATAFCEGRDDARIFTNLPTPVYWALLRDAGCLVGNSSSGIMETGSLGLPTVNVGARQDGRTRGPQVIDVPAEAGAIRAAVDAALDPGFRASLAGMENPYGDGHAGRRIAAALAAAPDRDSLLHKRPLPLAGTAFRHD
jgi:UDP-N-acetylglucosamine 2-epimerase (non-hydrolysing)/GDP/UDP-N,N'-diacetylbacillosamine 2-epimerase (hydrolysing)